MIDAKFVDDFITNCLLEISWKLEFPYKDDVCINSFFSALIATGFEAKKKDEKICFSFPNMIDGYTIDEQQSLSTSEILVGWGQVPGTPRAAYNSCYTAIDKLHNQLKPISNQQIDKHKFENILAIQRDNLGREMREALDYAFKSYINKYQESAFYSFKHQNNELDDPQILDRLFRTGAIDLENINYSLMMRNIDEIGRGISNVGSTIEMSQGIFDFTQTEIDYITDHERAEAGDKDVYPAQYTYSKDQAEDYIWAAFLMGFSSRNGYPMQYSDNDFSPDSDHHNLFEYIVDHGWNVYETMNPRKYEELNLQYAQ